MPRVTGWTLGAATVAFAALSMLFLSIATADETGAVSVTVTPAILSISVPTGAVGFGTTPIDTTVSAIDGKTVTNNGNVTWAALSGNFATSPPANCGTGGNWDASTAADVEIFVMNLDSDAADVSPADGAFDAAGVNVPGNGNPSAAINTANVVADGTVAVDFELMMPTLVGTGDNECTIALTLTASS